MTNLSNNYSTCNGVVGAETMLQKIIIIIQNSVKHDWHSLNFLKASTLHYWNQMF